MRSLRVASRMAELELGLSGAQLFVLQCLARHSPCSVKELAARTATDQSSVSVVVGRLVVQGHIRRSTSRADRRKVETSLTASGRALLGRAHVARRDVVSLALTDTIQQVCAWFASDAVGSHHPAYPVLDESGLLLGVVTRRELLSRHQLGSAQVRELLKTAPAVAFEDDSLREAADLMVTEGIGRLSVVTRAAPHRIVGILTRTDLLSAHARRLKENHHLPPSRLPREPKRPKKAG